MNDLSWENADLLAAPDSCLHLVLLSNNIYSFSVVIDIEFTTILTSLIEGLRALWHPTLLRADREDGYCQLRC